MSKEYIKALKKSPEDKTFRRVMVRNDLKRMQDHVGGNIEAVRLGENLIVICNEEGRIKGLPYNCRLGRIEFVGPILMVGEDGEEFGDLSEDALRFFSGEFYADNAVDYA